MVNSGKTTSQLPIKTSPNDLGDRIVIIYAANTSNSAQTATISISNLLSNTGNLHVVAANLQVDAVESDPANSQALSVTTGTMFFSNAYGYIAIANNYLRRWPISSF